MSILKCFSVCLGILLVVPAFAQKPAAPIKAKLRLLACSPDQELSEVFIHDPAAADNAVPASYEIRGFLNREAITVPLRSRKMVFTLAKDRESMTREDELLGEVTLPDKESSAIVVFLPVKPGEKTKARALVVPDSAKAFPAGSFLIQNVSGNDFKIQLESRPYEFKAGDSGLILDPPTRANGSDIGMRGFVSVDGEWREHASSIWSHPGETRSLMILLRDPGNDGFQFRSFKDVKPDAPVADAPGKKGKKKK